VAASDVTASTGHYLYSTVVSAIIAVATVAIALAAVVAMVVAAVATT